MQPIHTLYQKIIIHLIRQEYNIGEAVDVAASEPGVADWLRQVMAGYCVAGRQAWLPVVMK